MVLVGPSGSGKTQWAGEWFGANQIVSSDRLRALVGEGEHDQRAGVQTAMVRLRDGASLERFSRAIAAFR